jgi:DMSO/TMAO reductase YedYZ molybdopterin-dependent catalytic subunit
MTDNEKPRLPPGQRVVRDLPTRHVGVIPPFDPDTWRLQLDGEVLQPRALTYQELRSLPSVISVSDFHCVETWSLYDLAWEGVRFSEIADLVAPTPRARFVTIGCEGDYTTDLPLDDLMQPDVLLAWGLDGRPLTPEHGFPLRLVVPHKYAYKAAKWVRRIRCTYDRELGYWEQRGYHDGADPWQEERFS